MPEKWLFQIRPYLVDIGRFGLLLPGFLLRIPRADAQESHHVHLVDLRHGPAVLQQRIVGRVDVLRQRQIAVEGVVSVSFVTVAVGFVGKSSSTSVVCVCTAMSASARSCTRRSLG